MSLKPNRVGRLEAVLLAYLVLGCTSSHSPGNDAADGGSADDAAGGAGAKAPVTSNGAGGSTNGAGGSTGPGSSETGAPELMAGVTSLVVSKWFGCALLSDKRVACWGNSEAVKGTEMAGFYAPHIMPDLAEIRAIYSSNNRLVALGEDGEGKFLGPPFARNEPVTGSGSLPPLPAGTVQLAIGDFFGCALTDMGEVWCWGDNVGGQLGNGVTFGDPAPEPIKAHVEDVKAIAVSPTGTGACALGNDGTVTCWPGGSLSGDYNIADPVVIPDIDDATQLTVGGSHACVLREGGRVSCWGYNDDGQLGSGKAEEGTIRSGLALRGASFVPTPTSVDVVGVEDVQTIAAGVADTCAVLASGETLCWGANSKEGNQLALPDYNYNTFRSDPVPSPQGIPRLPAASYANIGESHGCALTVTGNVWCWGLGKLVGQARPTQAYNAPAPLPAP